LEGKPIVARRSTPAERLAKWCRRNPAIAALTGAVALLLILAVAILTAKNASIRREAEAKDAALVTARKAVDQMLMRVGNDKLHNMPLGHPLREELLKDALYFYESLLPQAQDDAILREEIASVLSSLGVIQRELGRIDDAINSYERSIEYLRPVADSDPNPPRLREKLAALHEALAFTWSINSSAEGQRESDRHYRKTLELFHQIERDFPERPQPVALCLRHLAKSALAKGNLTEAEQYWRQAIERPV
jgi:tetratricopeptide (TPR) repeat protein